MPKALKITLRKSLIGEVPKNVRTAHALGIRKISQFTINHPSEAIKGMLHQIKHLIVVEEVEVDEIKRKRQAPHLKKTGESVTKPMVVAKAAKVDAPKAAKVTKAKSAPAEEKPKRVTKKTTEKK